MKWGSLIWHALLTGLITGLGVYQSSHNLRDAVVAGLLAMLGSIKAFTTDPKANGGTNGATSGKFN
jgi:hypothetical protein